MLYGLVGGAAQLVSAGGFALDTVVSSGGTETVWGNASGSVVDGGAIEVADGGQTFSAEIGDGGAQTIDGGSATATEVDAGGFQFVVSGGVSVDAIVANGGTAIVLSGGTETSASIAGGGAAFVFTGGLAGGGTVADCGALTVSSGGGAGLVEVAAGGSATIEAGGVAAFDQVDAGGFETVSGRAISETISGTQSVTGAGATTTGTYVEGGDATVRDGGTASGTVVDGPGGVIDEYDGGSGSFSVFNAGGNDVVHAGGVASGAALLGGRQVVSSGGIAVGTVIDGGGHQFVYAGGTATNTQVRNGGVEVVSCGGIADGTSIADGGTEVVSSGGIPIGGTDLADGGTLAVADGAVFNGADAEVTLDAGAQLLVGAGDVLNLVNIPLANHGDILLAGNSYGGGGATLRVAGDVSLSGGGTVSMCDLGGYSNAGVIVGVDAGALLDNIDNTIAGWGQLGAGMLAFTNEAGGTVTAAYQTLLLHTGRTVFNNGLMDATTGTLLIEDDVDNASTIAAADGLVRLGGDGNAATIRGGALDSSGDGSMEVTSAAGVDGTSSPVSVSARLLVDSAAALTLSGAIANAGTINLNGNTYGGGVAALRIQGAVTLTGGGAVQMRDLGGYSTAGLIAGGSAADSLVNAGNTISGWGSLGAGALSFTNAAAGVVDADTASRTLFVDTGAGALVNRGILEAKGGILAVAGGLLNDGTVIEGASGVVSLAGPVGGTGTIALDGPALTLVAAIGTGQTVAFAADTAATLYLADPGGFGGSLSGFGSDDALDIQGAMATISYAAGAAGGPGRLVLNADGTLVRVVRAMVSADSGTLRVAPLAGGTVSLDTILAAPAYAPAGTVSRLVVDGPGTVATTADVTIADVQVKSGTFRLNGQTISTDPVKVTAGSAIAGNGRVTGAVTDDGTIVAQGGTLELTGDIGGGGALAVGVGATLALDGATGAALGIDFLPGGGETLSLGAPLATAATISGFLAGDLIRFAGSYGSVGHSFSGGVLTVTGDGATVASLTFGNGFDGADLSVSATGAVVTVAEAMACYAAGTRIQTPRGEVAIQDLVVGDAVTTMSGAARPLRWIGRRHVDLARHPAPREVFPIRIKAGALADGVPARDLLVSPDHGMLVDGVLLPARLPLNGRSVVVSPRASVTYFHLELDSHDILLAEGAAAESFLDTGNRAVFDNAAVTDLRASFRADRAVRGVIRNRREAVIIVFLIRIELVTSCDTEIISVTRRNAGIYAGW